MTRYIFDATLFAIGAAFIVQALRTPPETYDVMGPALWPFTVALATVLLILARVLQSQPRAALQPMTMRLAGIALLAIAFVGLQAIAAVPFFLSATIFMFLAYLLMSRTPARREYLPVLAAALGFTCFLQWIFTSVINLDLPTGF